MIMKTINSMEAVGYGRVVVLLVNSRNNRVISTRMDILEWVKNQMI